MYLPTVLILAIALQAPLGNQPTHDWIDKLNATSTAVIALFTLGLFASVVFQVIDFRRRERAWMMADFKTHIPTTIDGGANFRFRIDIQNLGETPAKIIGSQSVGKIVKSDEKLPAEPAYPASNDHASAFFLAPTGGSPLYFTIKKIAMEEISRGERILWAYGRIQYRDTFKRHHETRYCFRYYPPIPGSADTHIGFFEEGPPRYISMK